MHLAHETKRDSRRGYVTRRVSLNLMILACSLLLRSQMKSLVNLTKLPKLQSPVTINVGSIQYLMQHVDDQSIVTVQTYYTWVNKPFNDPPLCSQAPSCS